jgi:hypothetical protein
MSHHSLVQQGLSWFQRDICMMLLAILIIMDKVERRSLIVLLCRLRFTLRVWGDALECSFRETSSPSLYQIVKA